MAKREPIQKSEPFRQQQKLFEDNQPKQSWKSNIDRKGIDLKARSMIKQGRTTYIKNYNSLTCQLCGRTTNYQLEVLNDYCMNCNVLHTIDYAEDK